MSEIYRGAIKNIIRNRQFGFIREPITRGEFFFHKMDYLGNWNDLANDVENDKIVEVEFNVAESAKGPRAANVRRVE